MRHSAVSERRYERALITGATSGIGAAFAETLPRDTALLLTGRRGHRLAAQAERFAREGRQVETMAADLAAPNGRAAFIAWALEHEIDLFICNAAIGAAGRFADTPLAAQQATIALNVVAVAELLHALLPAMASRARAGGRRCGAIIVSSTAAFTPRPGLACYAATKAFGLSLGLALAAELRGEPIDLLLLCPRRTATEFFARAGMPPPSHAMDPDQVAREGLAALGRRSLHFCGTRHQALNRLLAFNPALAAIRRPWRWRRGGAADGRPPTEAPPPGLGRRTSPAPSVDRPAARLGADRMARQAANATERPRPAMSKSAADHPATPRRRR
jgi:short-subunit dehydrogenase